MTFAGTPQGYSTNIHSVVRGSLVFAATTLYDTIYKPARWCCAKTKDGIGKNDEPVPMTLLRSVFALYGGRLLDFNPIFQLAVEKGESGGASQQDGLGSIDGSISSA